MWRKTESHNLHGFKYLSQTHLYCCITYGEFLILNFETDQHFCICNQCSVPQVDEVRHTNDANLRIYLSYSSLSRLVFTGSCSVQHLSISDAAPIHVPNSQLWHQFVELTK